MNVFELFATISLKSDGVEEGLNKTKSLFSSVNDVANNVVGTIIDFGAKAGAALMGLGTAAVAIGTEYEKEMKNIQAITGMTDEEISIMGEGIRKIATDTGKDVLELAGNAKMVAEAGGDMVLMMSQLEQGTNLALATQTDMATTLDFLGSAMKTFGIEAEDTQSVVDSFAYVTTLANLELSQIGEAFVNVGGSAAIAGMSIDDVNAILVTFSNAGLKGGAAGTSLNAILKNLSTPTDKAAEALDELNVALYDNEGASRSTFDIMKDLTVALADKTDEERSAAEAAIFDGVAQKGWNMIVAEGIDSIMELSEELSTTSEAFDGLGQAAGMAATQQQSLSGMMDKLKAVVQDLGISFYEYIQEPLKEVVQTANDMVTQLSEAFASGGLEGLVSSVGDVLSQVVEYIISLAPEFIGAATQLITSLVEGLTENKDSILAGATEAFGMILDAVDEILPMLVPLAGDIINELINGFIDYYEMIYTTGVDIFTELLSGLAEKAPELVDSAQEAIENIINTIADNLPEMLNSGISIISELISGITESLPQIIEQGQSIISSVIDAITENLPELLQSGMDMVMQLLDGIVQSLPEIVSGAQEIIMQLVGGLGSYLPEILQAGIDIILELVSGISEMLPELIPMAVEIIMSLVNTLLENLDEIILVAMDLVLALIEGISNALPDLLAAIPEIIFTIVDGILENLPEILESGIDIIFALIDGIINALPDLIASIPNVIFAIVEAIIDNLDKLLEASIQIMVQLGVGLIKSIFELTKVIPEIGEKVMNKFSEIDWASIGTNILNGIKNGVLGAVNTVVDAAKEVGGKIVDGFKSFFGIHSPSVLFRDEVGLKIAEGLAVGMEEGTTKTVKAAEKMSKRTYEAAVLWIKDYRNDMNYLKSEELAMWNMLAQNYAEGTEYRVKAETEARKMTESIQKEETAAYKSAIKEREDAQKKFYEDAKLNIQDYQNQVEYSIEEEIRMWEDLKTHYTSVSKEKVEIDKSINKLREELRKEEVEAQKKADEESFNFSKQWIEARSNMNQLTWQEEIEAWQRVADRYEEGTKQKEEAEKNLSKVRDDLRKEEEKAITEMEKLEQKYQDTLASRAQEIFNTFSMFAEVNLQETNVDKNTKKVEESRDAYEKVQATLKDLDTEQEKAYKTLTESVGKVTDKMNDGNKTTEQYNKLQEESAKAQDTYSKKMEDIAKKREEAIKKLNKAEEELTKATEEAAKTQAKVMAENLEDQIKEMENWEKQMKELSKRGLDEGLLEELRKMGPTATRYLEQLNASSDEELTKLSDLYQYKHKLARELAVDELKELRRQTDDEITNILADLTYLMATEANPVGTQMIQGIINGVNEKSNELMATMTRVMNDVIAIANQIPQIHSPSRVFQRIGGFITQGLAIGISSTAKDAVGAMGDIINDVIDIAEEMLEISSPSKIFKSMGQMVGEGFVDGIESVADLIDETVSDAFSGFDVDSIDAKYNVSGSSRMSNIGAGDFVSRNSGRSERPVEFKFTQQIIVGENSNSRQAKQIGRQIFEGAKEDARSKGVDVF